MKNYFFTLFVRFFVAFSGFVGTPDDRPGVRLK